MRQTSNGYEAACAIPEPVCFVASARCAERCRER